MPSDWHYSTRHLLLVAHLAHQRTRAVSLPKRADEHISSVEDGWQSPSYPGGRDPPGAQLFEQHVRRERPQLDLGGDQRVAQIIREIIQRAARIAHDALFWLSGGEVEKYHRDGRIRDIVEYCESDVVNTNRLWLRYELFRGRLTEPQFEASEAYLIDFIKIRENSKPRLAGLTYHSSQNGKPRPRGCFLQRVRS